MRPSHDAVQKKNFKRQQREAARTGRPTGNAGIVENRRKRLSEVETLQPRRSLSVLETGRVRGHTPPRRARSTPRTPSPSPRKTPAFRDEVRERPPRGRPAAEGERPVLGHRGGDARERPAHGRQAREDARRVLHRVGRRRRDAGDAQAVHAMARHEPLLGRRVERRRRARPRGEREGEGEAPARQRRGAPRWYDDETTLDRDRGATTTTARVGLDRARGFGATETPDAALVASSEGRRRCDSIVLLFP